MTLTRFRRGKTGATGAQGDPGTGVDHGAGMLTGTYVGDGNDDRVINIGVDLAAMDDAVVMVFGSAKEKRLRIETGAGDVTDGFDNIGPGSNMIQSFTAVGFVLGTNLTVNGLGVAFRWIAYWSNDP